MMTSDLYGLREGEPEAVSGIIGRILEVEMQDRDSSYRAGEYYLGRTASDDKLAVQRNFDPECDEWAEDDFTDMKVLVYVDSQEHADSLRQLLTSGIPDLQFLMRKVLSDDKRFRVFRMIDGKETVVIDKQVS